MNIKKFLGLPLYLKLKESNVKKNSLIVNPFYDFTLYCVLRNRNNFALVIDENLKVSFISTLRYVNIDYNFELNTNRMLKDELEYQEIVLSEDFFNYFQSAFNNYDSTPSICLFEKYIKDSFVILEPQDESKGYWVDLEIKIYVSNSKTKFNQYIDSNDTRTVYSNLATLKSNIKTKNLYLNIKRVFNVKKNVSVLASEIKF
jgi:hypothetical protein